MHKYTDTLIHTYIKIQAYIHTYTNIYNKFSNVIKKRSGKGTSVDFAPMTGQAGSPAFCKLSSHLVPTIILQSR